jgi:hypothetical protein
MAHLASAADRIGRSYSPCGGREERDLVKKFKESSGQLPLSLYQEKTAVAGLYCNPSSLPLSLLHG